MVEARLLLNILAAIKDCMSSDETIIWIYNEITELNEVTRMLIWSNLMATYFKFLASNPEFVKLASPKTGMA